MRTDPSHRLWCCLSEQLACLRHAGLDPCQLESGPGKELSSIRESIFLPLQYKPNSTYIQIVRPIGALQRGRSRELPSVTPVLRYCTTWTLRKSRGLLPQYPLRRHIPDHTVQNFCTARLVSKASQLSIDRIVVGFREYLSFSVRVLVGHVVLHEQALRSKGISAEAILAQTCILSGFLLFFGWGPKMGGFRFLWCLA